MLMKIWIRLLETGERAAREERGDSLINWVVLAVGLAAAAAAGVALISPAVRGAASKIVSLIGG